MKKIVALFVALFSYASVIAAPTITGISTIPHSVRDGKVDVEVSLTGTLDEVAKVILTFTATDTSGDKNLPVSHIEQQGEDVGSGTSWTRKFVWDAKADVGEILIDNVLLSVNGELQLGGVQLWEDGPYFAECNVGATNPGENGYYFWWGDTIGYRSYGGSWTGTYNFEVSAWVSSTGVLTSERPFYPSDCPTYDKTSSQLQSLGYVDSSGNLTAEYDAATAHLGTPWRMPTNAELKALLNNCDITMTSRTNVKGLLVKGRGDYSSKSIFLPAAGYGRDYSYYSRLEYLHSYGFYWSSTSRESSSGLCLRFDSDSVSSGGIVDRCFGQPVRPVREYGSGMTNNSAVSTNFAIDCRENVIVSVSAQQRHPEVAVVDIVVTLAGTEEGLNRSECVFAARNGESNVELPISHLTEITDGSGETNAWIRKFEWNAKEDLGAVKIADIELSVTLKPKNAVQFWEDGPYWAECNVGATKPEDAGYYFWWGDTIGCSRINDKWSTIDESDSDFSFFSGNCPPFGMSNAQLQTDGYIDESGALVAEHDAASKYLGGLWRMPTSDELQSLIDNCTVTWVITNGVKGCLVEAKNEFTTKKVFFPAAGDGRDKDITSLEEYGLYWSSSPVKDDNSNAYGFYFAENGYGVGSNYRKYGRSIRAVCDVSCTTISFPVNLTEDPVIAPESGTTFSSSLTISMSCATEGAVIHYTIDGSDPTMESPVYKRFRISGKTMVKARAFYEDGTGSEVVTAEYAFGQCPGPVISTTGGETFYHKGNQVSIAYDCEEGVVHYTTDGSEPTKESPVYEGPFTTDESMVVKAKAFSDNYFDSAIVTATLTREWEQVVTPIITAAESFTGAKAKVEITSATEGATIRYTLNGSDPNSHAKKYVGPFFVTEGCTIKAYAVLEDYTNSEIAAKAIAKVWGIGDSVALPDQTFTTSGDAEWVDANGEAMKSGAITDNQKSILSTTFVGKGVLSFKWKVSCEDDEKDSWDHAAFFVDGAEIKRQDGITDWHEISHSIETDGSHIVEWVYVKDDAEADNDDCMWVKDIVWMPEKTQTSEVKVETTWLKAKYPTLGNYYFDYEEMAKETAANGHKVWECYVAGEDPTDSASKFAAEIMVGEDGKPSISWNPDLGEARVYKILGSTDLKTWVEIPEGEEADYNFFKVSVEMK